MKTIKVLDITGPDMRKRSFIEALKREAGNMPAVYDFAGVKSTTRCFVEAFAESIPEPPNVIDLSKASTDVAFFFKTVKQKKKSL